MNRLRKIKINHSFVSQFSCETGSIAFIIPFYFTNFSDDKCSDNVCSRLFRNIDHKIQETKNKTIYKKEKKRLVATLKQSFPRAAIRYNCPNWIKQNSENKENEDYSGRNLCKCFSVCRKFHDDHTLNTDRLEVYLGTYNIEYDLTDGLNPKYFHFSCDAVLLLTNESGSECGYIILKIDQHSISQNIFEKDSVDFYIFIKHLFYKNRLKCSIADKYNISIQEWCNKFLCKLMQILELDPSQALNKHVLKNVDTGEDGAAFSYSIMQLDNVYNADKQLISIENVELFKRQYVNQLYGLLVSDEGWRNISKNELLHLFSDNHWASRINTCSFFFGRNILTINQKNDLLKSESYHWFDNYINIDVVSGENNTAFYSQYGRIQPCFPGVKSLTLFFFLKVIYKDMMIGKTKEYLAESSDSPDENLKILTRAIQSYSMSLETTRDVENRICSQFGIPSELEQLRFRCKLESENRQNNKVRTLTIATVGISIISIIVSMLSINNSENLLLNADYPVSAILYILLVFALFIFAVGLYTWEKIQSFAKKIWLKCVHSLLFQ